MQAIMNVKDEVVMQAWAEGEHTASTAKARQEWKQLVKQEECSGRKRGKKYWNENKSRRLYTADAADDRLYGGPVRRRSLPFRGQTVATEATHT